MLTMMDDMTDSTAEFGNETDISDIPQISPDLTEVTA